MRANRGGHLERLTCLPIWRHRGHEASIVIRPRSVTIASMTPGSGVRVGQGRDIAPKLRVCLPRVPAPDIGEVHPAEKGVSLGGIVAFSLVALPVRLYAATQDHDVPLHQVHANGPCFGACRVLLSDQGEGTRPSFLVPGHHRFRPTRGFVLGQHSRLHERYWGRYSLPRQPRGPRSRLLSAGRRVRRAVVPGDSFLDSFLVGKPRDGGFRLTRRTTPPTAAGRGTAPTSSRLARVPSSVDRR